MKFLEKYSDHVYAVLRIVAGFMFSLHGFQKIFRVLTDKQPDVFSQLWFGGVIEIIGGILIMIGFQTRIAAFICSGMMAVAYFQFHWKFSGGEQIFPVVNRGELAALYCFLFLYFATRGAVKWGLDNLLKSKNVI